MNAHEFAHVIAESGMVAEIYRAVEPAYPNEGCGFVFESAAGELTVFPTVNRADELHRKDPKRYPIGGHEWFEPDMKPWLKAVRDGQMPRVIFHSHPDVGAYFSSGDHESAVHKDEDGNIVERNPGVWHIVVSVRDGAADGSKMFQFDATTQCFVTVAEFGAQGELAHELVANFASESP